jgi:hypothetical protein
LLRAKKVLVAHKHTDPMLLTQHAPTFSSKGPFFTVPFWYRCFLFSYYSLTFL